MGVCPSSHKEGTRGCPQDAVTGLTQLWHTGCSTRARDPARGCFQIKKCKGKYLPISYNTPPMPWWAPPGHHCSRGVWWRFLKHYVCFLFPLPACLQCAWLQTGTGSILSTHGTREPTFSIRLYSRNKTPASKTQQCGTKPTWGRTMARQEAPGVLGATWNVTVWNCHWAALLVIRGLKGAVLTTLGSKVRRGELREV